MDALSKKTEPRIVMINGAPTDSNGVLFKKGAHSAIDGKLRVLKEYDTPDWSPDQAQDEIERRLCTAVQDRLDESVMRRPMTAAGRRLPSAAMKAAGVKSAALPVHVVRTCAELAAVQRIVLHGEQYMTVYKAIPARKAESRRGDRVRSLAGRDNPFPPR